MFDQSKALLWAQWRSLRNYYSRNTGGLAFVVGFAAIWYGLVVAGSAGAAFLLSRLPTAELVQRVVSTGLLMALMYWQVVPLMLAATGATVDLKRVIVYPINARQLFGIEVLLRLTTGIEVLLLLIGGTIGLLLNPQTPFWGPLVFLPFVAMNLFLSAGLRDMISRLLARRGVRELAVIVLVALTALPSLLIQKGSVGKADQWIQFFAQGHLLTPWWAAAYVASGERIGLGAAVLLFWTWAAFRFGKWQFQRGLRFDADAARATVEKRVRADGLLEKIYRIPSALFPDPMGALLEKELRFLSRAPRFRLVFIMGFTFGLIIWLPLTFREGPAAGTAFAANYLTFVTVYALLLLGEVCFWNAFGFDRSAAQLYFLAPVKFTTVLASKNIAAAGAVFLEVLAVATVCRLLGMPVSGPKLLEAFLVTLVLTVFLLAAGNLASMYNPRAVNPAHSWRSSASKFQALLLLLYPALSIPIILAYLARYALDAEWAFYAVLLFDLALAGVTYWIAMESAVAASVKEREKFVGLLTQGEGPVSS